MAEKWVLLLLMLAMAACGGSGEVGPVEEEEPDDPAAAAVTLLPAPEPGEPLCPDKPVDWVTDLEVRQTPDMDEPRPRAPFRDPTFGTCLIRVTDRAADPDADDISAGLKNEYSRVRSFNADGSRLLVYGIDGTWYLYDSHYLLPLGQLPLDLEPRWDAADPDLIYHLDETRLQVYDVSAGQSELVHDFSQDFPGQSLAAVWTRYEGSPSADSRYWGLIVEDEQWLAVAFIVYDLELDQVIARRDLTGLSEQDREIDSVTITPLGTYLLAYFDTFCEHGQLGDVTRPCGLMVYSSDLQRGRSLLRIVGHSDVVLDGDGREVLIYQDIDTDAISMLDLESGSITPLYSIDFSHSPIGFHFSGQAFQQPGWALVSTYSGGYPSDHTWMDDQVFALELKADGRLVRLAHTHSLVDELKEHDYWAEPQASVNQDFTKVLFTSNWGRSGTGEVDTFLIELPVGWVEE